MPLLTERQKDKAKLFREILLFCKRYNISGTISEQIGNYFIQFDIEAKEMKE